MRDGPPTDWWTDREASAIVVREFRRFCAVIVTEAIHQKTGQRQLGAFSGFLIYYRDRAYWVSAGHVVKTLKDLPTNDTWTLISARLVDAPSCLKPPANALVLDLSTVDLAALDITGHPDARVAGLDVGLMRIDQHMFRLLTANPNVRFFTDSFWKDNVQAAPDGCYLIGTPQSTVKILTTPSPTDGELVTEYSTVCLPVRILDQVPDGWNHYPGSFYGEIVSLNVGDNKELDCIKGMSGGTIVSVEPIDEEAVTFRLVGIQSEWNRNTRCIRATRIEQLITIIDLAIDDRTGLFALAGSE